MVLIRTVTTYVCFLLNELFNFFTNFYIHSKTHQIVKVAAKLNASFILVCGDITYDNGFPSCFKRWDRFLGLYSQVRQLKLLAFFMLIFLLTNDWVFFCSLLLQVMVP